MSLVPDYGDSESDDDDSETEEKEATEPEKCVEIPKLLPSAAELLHGNSSTKGGVFNNPYKEAELAFSVSLSKHVEMVDADSNLQMKNGKKICWNYRKGRCRFASNCTFAHDSDLHEFNRKQNNRDIDINGKKLTTSDPVASQNDTEQGQKSKELKSVQNSGKSKRPGLSNTLNPSKKIMKMYKAQRKC